ncbi:uncharacterized protein LOC125312714 [Rhodamnia argentea]|uniref:Uncharacterized protein LOC125312714 n=1 Tax=Rhodamnia argentea TaxID=178133 RepID=A0ABM3GTV8_9MYRT|nr:uncharacterized protein LOC125312714 [Rhodamnia argentea]
MDSDIGYSQRASCLSNFGLSPSSSWNASFRYLEELCLNGVTVEGELIEQPLAICPVLERLILGLAPTLNRVRASGRSLKLKYLSITCCFDLKCVEIYDTNLVSFAIVGPQIPLCLDKLPQLSEVSIEGFSLRLVHVTLSQLSSLSCLQILKLQFYDSPDENLLIRQLPKLVSVKKLELRVHGLRDASLLPLTLLIEACPCMQSFVFELMDPREMLCRQREPKRVVQAPHRYLKEVEFSNYYGRPCDHELVNYLVENAFNLEKLVVNPCEEEWFTSEMKKVKEPRERALQQLEGKLPSRIDLVIN